MSKISRAKFDKDGLCKFIDYEGKPCHLTRETWRIKTQHPERRTLKYNFDKIRLTITYPEEVRTSSKRRDSKILYRKFAELTVAHNLVARWNGYIAVVIDQKRGRIQTIYPTYKKKEGEKLWPK